MTNRKSFFETAAANWDNLHPAPAQLPAVRRGLELAGSWLDQTVLDVGCGTGILTGLLLEQLGTGQLIALDFAAPMIERARARHSDSRVTWLVRDLFDSGLATGSIDLILCYNTFPHFPAQDAVSEFRRLLRPGGRLLIWHDAGADRIAAIHAMVGGAVAHDRLPDLQVLQSLVQQAGLEVRHATHGDDRYELLAILADAKA